MVKAIVSILLATALTAANTRIEATARRLLVNFTAGRFEAATKDFNDTLKEIVTPSLLAQMKQQCDEKLGAFLSVTSVRHTMEERFRVVELTAKYEKLPATIRVTFDAFDRVGAVSIDPILPPPVDPALEAVARELLTHFVAERFELMGKNFDAAMRRQLPPASLAILGKQIAERFGTFRSVDEIGQRTNKGFRIIDLFTTYDKGPVAVRVVFDDKGRVNGIYISPYVRER